MCGIAGFFVNGQAGEARGTLQRMTDSLRHRGPDDEGFYVDAQIALGARRLRIIDLETGQEPVANEDGSAQVIQNGEIYNFAALPPRPAGHGPRVAPPLGTQPIADAPDGCW